MAKETKNMAVRSTEQEISIPDYFYLNGERVSTRLNMDNIKSDALRTETEALQTSQTLFARNMVSLNAVLVSYAKTLYTVQTKTLYKPDFKNMGDYAESIGLAIAKSSISGMVVAGSVYTDPNAPEQLKALPYTVLAKLGAVLHDSIARDALYEYARSADYTPFNQKTASEYNDTHKPESKGKGKNGKTTTDHMFTAKLDDGTEFHAQTTDAQTGDIREAREASGTEFRDTLRAMYPEVIDLPVKDNFERVLCIDKDGKPRIVYLTIYSAVEAEKARKAFEKAETVKSIMKRVASGELTLEQALALAAE